jgi:hypothetical protein
MPAVRTSTSVDADEIARQPQRQRHEGAEHEEIVEREPPDLQVLQHRHLRRGRRRRSPLAPPGLLLGILLGQQEEHHRHHDEADRPDLCHRLPAHRDHDEGRHELGHRRADIPRPEDAERRALLALRVELRDIGDAHRERAAGEPDPSAATRSIA